jgi:hypothetical protein
VVSGRHIHNAKDLRLLVPYPVQHVRYVGDWPTFCTLVPSVQSFNSTKSRQKRQSPGVGFGTRCT